MERRTAERRSVCIEVELAGHGCGICRGTVLDVSQSGVCIQVSTGRLPARQTRIRVGFRFNAGSTPLYRQVTGLVKRCDGRCIGVEFLRQDFFSAAVLEELGYYRKHERQVISGCAHGAC